jgi:hypothetical protein
MNAKTIRFFFSLVVRTNPFNPNAQAAFKDDVSK